MLAKLRKTLIHSLVPVEKVIGPLHWPVKSRLVTGGDYGRVLAVAKPGDAIVTRTRGCFSNVLIPGFWSHAAFFLGDDQISVLEAVGNGVQRVSLWEFMLGTHKETGKRVDLGKDFMRVLRPNFATEEQKRAAAKLALEQCGKPYDYEFEFATDKFYCAELVWWTYLRACEREPFAISKVMNLGNAAPDDLAASPDWSLVIEVGGNANG